MSHVAQRTALQPRQRRRDRGFTLIEIMVVVIIIALLAAVVVPQFLGRVEDARVAKAKEDIQAIDTALTMFKLDNYVYPTTTQGLQALVTKPDDPPPPNWRDGGYLQHLNKDPWGHPYQYQVPGTHGGGYEVCSLGPNAQSDTADTNPKGEICNWNLGN